ncbi:hypothetical protein AX14_000017 [Amanita brunnescens Koide BX004]|nr:hypothetical protein AX14_000017 [Amanita brunnescens Koide BX004]
MLRLLIDVSYAEPQDLRLPQRHRSLSQSCPPSDSSSLASPSESDDNSKELSHSSRPRSRSHIPRPRNAFMIFRSEFCAGEKISRSVERDHRHISRIIGYYWNKLPESEKDVWRRKAEQEKSEHLRKYPGYRFTPTVRAKRPVKRNVKRNGADDLLRCQILADFLMLGKEGKDLEDAAKTLEADTQPPATRVDGSIYDSFPENDRMPSFHRSSYAEMPGNLVVGFPVQSYCYPSTAERSFSFEAASANTGWELGGPDLHIRNGESPGVLYQLRTQSSNISAYYYPAREQLTMSCWQQYHDSSLVDPSTFQFSSY